MNISAWAVRNPTPIILLFFLLTVLGIGGYRALGANEWPDVDFPTVVVEIDQPGASPAELETEIAKKVEDALTGIANLDHVRSTITEGHSATVVEFELGTNTQTALNDVRDAVSRIRQQLPGDIQEPVILHPNNAGEPFITYTISSASRSVAQLSRLIDEDVTRALLQTPGVSAVQRAGGYKREVTIALDAARLRAVGLTVDAVNAQLKTMNVNLPGGRGEVGGGEQGIRALGGARSVDELRARALVLPGGGTARLDTLGTVTDGYEEVRQIARLDGQPVVGFSVVRSQGAALVQTEAAVRKTVEALGTTLPKDVKLTMIRSLGTATNEAVDASIDALLLGGALAVVVVYAFLRTWPSTLIAGLAIPLSVLPTFWVMGFLGYSLNLMTLIGLTLIVGILVDDAIVDLENIHRHMDMGKTALQAALDATDEIGLAVVATTFTIVAVFVPVAFMPGVPGLFFRSFGLTVAIAVMFSLVVARTLTPMLAANLLKPGTTHHEVEPGYLSTYMRILNAALDHRWITIALACVVFVASLALVPMIPTGFMSAGDAGEARLTVELPTGVSLADTDRVVGEVTKRLQSPELSHVFATIGGQSQSEAWMGSTGASVSYASAFVVLVPAKARTLSIDEWVNQKSALLQSIPGARISLTKLGAVGAGKPVNLILRGTNPQDLADVAARQLADMRGIQGLRDVTSTLAEEKPEIRIVPRSQEAAEQGVSVATIGRMARLATMGDVDFSLAKFKDGDEQINIRVKVQQDVRRDLTAIGDVLVPGKAGLVPLRSVADIELGFGPVQLNRYDRARQVTFAANLGDLPLGTAMERVMGTPTMQKLPSTVTPDTLGESQIMAEIFQGFIASVGLGVFLIYAVLVLLFGGFLHPLTIMGALPLSIGGALAGLLLGHKELGMMALIGILMLMGLVTKNSILLVEYALRAIRNGMTRREALILAGRDRIRPILMTTIAMIAGMLPIAMSLGTGTERLSPMAIAVVGGLITSTLLTLVVVPAAFTIVDDVRAFLVGLVRRRIDAPAAPAPKAPAPHA